MSEINPRLRVQLLQHTENPERVVAQAARLCYSASDIDAIAERLTPEKTAAFIQNLIAMGHHSALEHASFTFGVEGVSRALTHQLVRHRIASFSQQSQRYVGMSTLPSGAIIPPSIRAQSGLAQKYRDFLQQTSDLYEALLQAGIAAEDARYVLPNACETKIIVTMNARELLHFFKLRCCNRAQWEIHDMADAMLISAQTAAPIIFKNAGPGCLEQACPEGKMTCGKIAEVRTKYSK